jgi:hypothetical protein
MLDALKVSSETGILIQVIYEEMLWDEICSTMHKEDRIVEQPSQNVVSVNSSSSKTLQCSKAWVAQQPFLS